jgi:tRNA(fMet)-specific endonuclease VapC
MAYLLDADFIIHGLKGDNATLTLLGRIAPDEIAISWPTLGEVYAGAYYSPNPDARLDHARGFLRFYARVEFDGTIIQRFGELRAFLRRRGQPITDIDLLVAATALEYDFTLLTYNRRHFDRIPDLRVYASH